jgi:putative membrane protein
MTSRYFMENIMSSPTKLVVIAVDFDNDIGKLGINTPVLGYDNILKIANEYALTAPQDSDLNVLFTALKLYRDLKKDESYSVEIVLVAGDENSSSRAGIKISRELDKVIEVTKANNAIVVVDSVEDEKVLPVIQSKVNVVGVERVVVEQLRGVEETYVLLGRYLRKVLEERRFSKIFLGLPGLIILTYSLLLTMNLVTYITPTISIIIAAFLIFKGFGLDEFVSRWWRLSPITRISLILSTISTAMTVIILYITLASRNFSSDIMSITLYISNTIPFLLLSLIPLIGGRLTLRILRRSIRVWRDLITLTVIIMLYGLITRISELIITTKPTDIQQVLLLLNEYKITNIFFIYVIIIMTVSAVLYVIERTAT